MQDVQDLYTTKSRKSSEHAMPESKSARYNIGAASRLTGVSREKIRIWERRYGAVEPARDDANLRKYSQQDVDRLILIRRLVDSGQAVSNVANLSLDELQARLQALAPKPDLSGALPQMALAVLSEGGGLARHTDEAGHSLRRHRREPG